MNACDIAKGKIDAEKPKSNVNTQFLDNIIKELQALPDCDTLNGAADKYVGIIEDQLNDALKQLEFLGPYTALLTIPTNPKKLSKYLKTFVKTVIGASIFEQIKSYKEQLEAYKNGLEEIQSILKAKAASLESCSIKPDRIELDSCVLDNITQFIDALDVDLGGLSDANDPPVSDTTIDQDIQTTVTAAISQLQLNPTTIAGIGITGSGTIASPLQLNLDELDETYASKTELNKNFNIVGYFHAYFDTDLGNGSVLEILDETPNMFTFTSDINFHYATATFLNNTDYLIMSDIQHRTLDSVTDGIMRFVDISGSSIRISAVGRAGGLPSIDGRFWLVKKAII